MFRVSTLLWWFAFLLNARARTCAQPRVALAILTPNSLTEAIAKCMLFGLESLIPIDLIYSYKTIALDKCVANLESR